MILRLTQDESSSKQAYRNRQTRETAMRTDPAAAEINNVILIVLAAAVIFVVLFIAAAV